MVPAHDPSLVPAHSASLPMVPPCPWSLPTVPTVPSRGLAVSIAFAPSLGALRPVALTVRRNSLWQGLNNRSVGRTNVNEVSSRSHCVLTMYVEGLNHTTGLKSFGKLHLVDLAGSERLKVPLTILPRPNKCPQPPAPWPSAPIFGNL